MKIEGGYLIVGSWNDAPLRFHWTVPLSAVIFGGLNWSPAFWLGFVIVVLVHEIGHAVAVRQVGGTVASIDVTGWGGYCEWYGDPTEGEDALVAAGGILAQLALLFGTVLVVLLIGDPQHPDAQAFTRALLVANLQLALINLIPLPPLDGVRAWRLLPLSWRALGEWRRRAGRPPARPPRRPDELMQLEDFLDGIPNGWTPPDRDRKGRRRVRSDHR